MQKMGRDITGSDPGGVGLSDEERLDWLRLIRADHVGPRTFRALLNHYGGARAALAALPDLAQRGGAGRPPRVPSRRDAERELAAAGALDVTLIALDDADYPPRLKMIDDAPPPPAVRGSRAALGRAMVAVVGARNASAAALRFAERLARDLGGAGVAIASGLARGIDAAAHRATLATGTVAALAGGHDRIYPPEHAELADAILAEGALISEMPLGWEPRARDFPRRNRLISGLAAGIVIVEAAKRSGSLITARCALEQGREVLAVPGSPLDPRAEGCNSLLKDGATLVTEAEDVLAVLRPILGQPLALAVAEPPSLTLPRERAADGSTPATEPADDERSRIIALLSPAPVPIDDLVRRSESSAAVVRITLFELELAGRLDRHGGGLVSLLQ